MTFLHQNNHFVKNNNDYTWIRDDNSYFVVISWNDIYPEYDFQDIEEKFNDWNEALNHFNLVIYAQKRSINDYDHNAIIALYQGKSHILYEPEYVKYNKLLGISSGMKDNLFQNQLFALEQIPYASTKKVYKIYAIPSHLEDDALHEADCFQLVSTFDSRLSELSIGAICTITSKANDDEVSINFLEGIPENLKKQIEEEINKRTYIF